MRYLKQDTSAVTGNFVGTGCAAMVQVDYGFPAVFYDSVVAPARYIYDRAYPAGIVLESRKIQTLFFESLFHIAFMQENPVGPIVPNRQGISSTILQSLKFY